MDNLETSPKKRIEKPVGVYIITAFDFLFIGLVPLLLTIWLSHNQDFELPFISLILSVSLAIFIMAASVWAWIGDNPARFLLLTLVTVSSLLMVVNNVMLISAGEIEGSQKISSVGNIIRGLFWIGINWWYFSCANTVAYYKQNA